eukprot:gene12701-6899_t
MSKPTINGEVLEEYKLLLESYSNDRKDTIFQIIIDKDIPDDYLMELVFERVQGSCPRIICQRQPFISDIVANHLQRDPSKFYIFREVLEELDTFSPKAMVSFCKNVLNKKQNMFDKKSVDFLKFFVNYLLSFYNENYVKSDKINNKDVNELFISNFPMNDAIREFYKNSMYLITEKEELKCVFQKITKNLIQNGSNDFDIILQFSQTHLVNDELLELLSYLIERHSKMKSKSIESIFEFLKKMESKKCHQIVLPIIKEKINRLDDLELKHSIEIMEQFELYHEDIYTLLMNIMKNQEMNNTNLDKFLLLVSGISHFFPLMMKKRNIQESTFFYNAIINVIHDNIQEFKELITLISSLEKFLQIMNEEKFKLDIDLPALCEILSNDLIWFPN